MREVQERGAGEIVLNCMASDGVRRGYDIEQLQRGARRSATCRWSPPAAPARREHFADVFEQAGVGCRAGRERVPQRQHRHPRAEAASCARSGIEVRP